MESSTKPTWTHQDIVKSAPGLIVGISSAFFVLGLLIVNLHLSRYGLYSKEFLRSEYVLAGAVFVLFMVSAEVGTSYFVEWMQKMVSLWRDKHFARILLTPYMLLPVLFVPLLLLLLSGNGYIGIKGVKTMGIPMGGVFMASAMFYHAYRQLKLNLNEIFPARTEQNTERAPHKRISKLFWPLLFVLSGITFYAKTTYPYISAVYGGGTRSPAIIYPTPRGYEVCKALSLPVNPNKSVGPLEVLTESEKEITILVQNGLSAKKIAIQLNKELLDATQTRTDDPFNG